MCLTKWVLNCHIQTSTQHIQPVRRNNLSTNKHRNMRRVLLENSEVYVFTTLVSQRLKATFPQSAEKGKKGRQRVAGESVVFLPWFYTFPGIYLRPVLETNLTRQSSSQMQGSTGKCFAKLQPPLLVNYKSCYMYILYCIIYYCKL